MIGESNDNEVMSVPFRSLTTLKGEVLPHLVRKQFIKPLKKKHDKDLPHPDVSVISLNTANRGNLLE